MTLPVTDSRDGARFLVRVVPRASRSAVAGIFGEGSQAALKVALQAPPVEGRANAALIDFLAELLHVRRADLAIAGGEHARTKTILVRSRTAAEVQQAIQQSLQNLA